MKHVIVNSKGRVNDTRIVKNPADVVSVVVDFGLFFGTDVASVASVTVDQGATVSNVATSGNEVTFELSSGSDGGVYDLFVTLQGTTETKRVVIQVVVIQYDIDSTSDYE